MSLVSYSTNSPCRPQLTNSLKTVEQEQYQRLSSRLHAQTGSFDVYKCTPNTPPGAQSTVSRHQYTTVVFKI